MRGLPTIVALSLLVHVAAMAWFVSRDSSEPGRRGTARAPAQDTAAPVESPAVEVMFVDDTPVAQVPGSSVGELVPAPVARPAWRRDHRAGTPAAVAATTPSTIEIPLTASQADPPNRRSLLSMRDGRPEPMIHRPGSDGISDEVLKQMIDGAVQVPIANVPGAREDAAYAIAQARLHNQSWVTSATPDQLTGVRLDREVARQAKNAVELVEQKDGTYRTEKKPFIVKTNRDGTVEIADKPNWQQKSLFYAEFDVTDALLRRHGQDPYASAKRQFLDRTRDQRVEIGKRYRTEQLAHSAQLMAANLRRLWELTPDPVKRKEELFALWDECAESGNDELIAGGADARRLLGNWVRLNHVEFTEAELQRFNARRQSKATFTP